MQSIGEGSVETETLQLPNTNSRDYHVSFTWPASYTRTDKIGRLCTFVEFRLFSSVFLYKIYLDR